MFAMTAASLAAAFLLVLGRPAGAQDLSATLGRVGTEYATSYAEPLTDAVGANLNTGLFHTARIGDGRWGLDLYVGLKAFGAMVPESRKAFSLTLADSADLPISIGSETVTVRVPGTVTLTDAPTIFGDTTAPQGSMIVDHDTTISYLGIVLPAAFDTSVAYETIGGLVDLPVFPSAVPQIGIGSLLGTDVVIRWLPQIDAADYGGIELFGLAVRHSVSQYIPLLPFDVAVQLAWQRVTADDGDESNVHLTTFATNVQLSKHFGALTLYGGLQSERSVVDIQYASVLLEQADGSAGDPIRISLSTTGRNTSRAVAGFSLYLGPVVFNADANVGRVTVFSTGLGVLF